MLPAAVCHGAAQCSLITIEAQAKMMHLSEEAVQLQYVMVGMQLT
jgi:hypothetical protein